ncbi:hypothetical protein EOA13_12115 [Mesorhizobium sp. M7A.F.Ca.US.011.01.1.1]|uniref:hypothetical protein n=1 Tax=Mesorhizobium sp. M7A.F.Ca.US.011.01.1.1 TaxID=2496741 RepID=UPI000FCC837D|nr:hypothetical protein [Mesorhizobium sp. M7A.F.Ca.US.011.01.1.1]RUX29784.1 hypothetical protein EOA13_12115 [Mesorhizobium sp. M7A.F.Ca.US.011.01.1.1]
MTTQTNALSTGSVFVYGFSVFKASRVEIFPKDRGVCDNPLLDGVEAASVEPHHQGCRQAMRTIHAQLRRTAAAHGCPGAMRPRAFLINVAYKHRGSAKPAR